MNRIPTFNVVEGVQYSLLICVFGYRRCLAFFFHCTASNIPALEFNWEAEIQKGKGFSHTVMRIEVNEICRVAQVCMMVSSGHCPSSRAHNNSSASCMLVTSLDVCFGDFLCMAYTFLGIVYCGLV